MSEKEKPISLLDLPVVDTPRTCQNCGSEDWSMARTNKEYYVVMCNKCPGVPEDWSPLDVVQ